MTVTSTMTASKMVKPFGGYSNVGVAYEGETPKELAEKAGLDFSITLTPVKYEIGEEGYISKENKVIVREDDPNINYGVCGKRWHPLQNEVVLERMLEFCKQGEDQGITLQRVGSFKKGKIIWALASTNQEFELEGGDKVTGNILIVNSHSVGKGLQIDLLTWRQVCENGMTVKVKIKSKVIPHTKSLDHSKVDRILEGTLNGFSEFAEASRVLSEKVLDLDTAYEFIINEFGDKEVMNSYKPSNSNLDEQPKVVRDIIKLYSGEAKGSEMLSSYNTGWGLLNACTEYINHHSKKTGGVEGHINSLWLESKARQQKRVYTQLVSVVGV